MSTARLTKGTCICHNRYGIGRVIHEERDNPAYTIRFDGFAAIAIPEKKDTFTIILTRYQFLSLSGQRLQILREGQGSTGNTSRLNHYPT